MNLNLDDYNDINSPEFDAFLEQLEAKWHAFEFSYVNHQWWFAQAKIGEMLFGPFRMDALEQSLELGKITLLDALNIAALHGVLIQGGETKNVDALVQLLGMITDDPSEVLRIAAIAICEVLEIAPEDSMEESSELLLKLFGISGPVPEMIYEKVRLARINQSA